MKLKMCNGRRAFVLLSAGLVLVCYATYPLSARFRTSVDDLNPLLSRDIEYRYTKLHEICQSLWAGRWPGQMSLTSAVLIEEIKSSLYEYVYLVVRIVCIIVYLGICLTKLILRGGMELNAYLTPYHRLCLVGGASGTYAFYKIARAFHLSLSRRVRRVYHRIKIRQQQIHWKVQAIHYRLSLVHYRTTKFLFSFGPYILFIAFVYLPYKLLLGPKALDLKLVTLVMMTTYSLVSVHRYRKLDTDQEESEDEVELQSAPPILRESETGSPNIVTKLKQLVTPRYLRTGLSSASENGTDLPYEVSNQVIICLSCWVGFCYYDMLLMLLRRATLGHYFTRGSLWFYVLSSRASVAVPSRMGSAVNVTDEVVLLVLCMTMCVRDSAAARLIRDGCAQLFDLLATYATGISISSRQRRLGRARSAAGRIDAAFGLLLSIFPQYTSVYRTFKKFKALFFNLLIVGLSLLLPGVLKKAVLVVYGGVIPLVYSSQATLLGDSAGANYWLVYTCLMNAAALCFESASTFYKLITVCVSLYVIEDPNAVYRLIRSHSVPSETPATAPPAPEVKRETTQSTRKDSSDELPPPPATITRRRKVKIAALDLKQVKPES